MATQGVCYFTGRGGTRETGLGAYLAERYGLLGGLGLSHEWLSQPHEDQLAILSAQLLEAEAAGVPVIANSYGAYLTLLALFDRPPLKTSVLLLSPVLGKTFLRGTYIRPPGGRRFAAAISSPAPKPAWLGLVMGAEDPGYVPATWDKLVAALQPDHHALLPGQGHSLEKVAVAGLVEVFVERMGEP
jgi:pimeloyl-ACP methyl ester carboxylesterase